VPAFVRFVYEYNSLLMNRKSEVQYVQYSPLPDRVSTGVFTSSSIDEQLGIRTVRYTVDRSCIVHTTALVIAQVPECHDRARLAYT
jgi:hypothetical protein